MDCDHVQEQIFEYLEAGVPAAASRDIEAHLGGCEACTAFAARQRTLDARLTAMFTAPELSSAFRHSVRARVRRETMSVWWDSLPDILHFAGCGLVTLLCVIVLPFESMMIVGTGATIAFASYALLTTIRHSFEEADLADR